MDTFKTREKLAARLGETLRNARREAELTQADVAERMGLVTEVYGRIERGLMLPSVPNLRQLCRVLRVDANVALGLEPSEETAAWLNESATLPEDPPRLRRLLRTLRQLDEKQLSALAVVARTFVQSPCEHPPPFQQGVPTRSPFTS
jgi:transcriptional regulator with XRE-family HTH domain